MRHHLFKATLLSLLSIYMQYFYTRQSIHPTHIDPNRPNPSAAQGTLCRGVDSVKDQFAALGFLRLKRCSVAWGSRWALKAVKPEDLPKEGLANKVFLTTRLLNSRGPWLSKSLFFFPSALPTTNKFLISSTLDMLLTPARLDLLGEIVGKSQGSWRVDRFLSKETRTD